MKYKIILILFLLVASLIYAKDSNAHTDVIDLIKELLKFEEANPIHKNDGDSINVLLDLSLNQKEFSQSLYNQIVNALYFNSSSWYEDSYDTRRLKSRRAILFACIALISDEESYNTFLDYAEFSLKGNCEIEDLLQAQYLGVLFIEALIILRNPDKDRSEIPFQNIGNFIDSNKDNLPDKIYAKAKSVLHEL